MHWDQFRCMVSTFDAWYLQVLTNDGHFLCTVHTYHWHWYVMQGTKQLHDGHSSESAINFQSTTKYDCTNAWQNAKKYKLLTT